MNLKLKYLPEKWLVIWIDQDQIENKEYFNTKENAKQFYAHLDKELNGIPVAVKKKNQEEI